MKKPITMKKTIVERSVLLLCLLSFTLYPVQALSKEAKTLLIVGDSLSAAYNLAEQQGWVYLLQQRLAQSEAYQHYNVINASVGGATSAAALQRLPALLKTHQPDLVILEIGANDGLQGKPVPYITNNLKQLIEQSINSGADVILVGIRLPPNFGKRYTEPFFAQYAALAEEYQLPLVPFLLEGVAGNNALMQADRLHPTAKAQPLILDNVWPILEGEL